jgi:UDP-glucose 4-epimerase
VLTTLGEVIAGDAPERLQFGALPFREGDTFALCADIAAARRDLGYEPRISLRDGLARTVAWFKARAAAVA